MAPEVPTSTFRQILEQHLDRLAAEMSSVSARQADAAREQLAENLNQAVRRLRLAESEEELIRALADAAAMFCNRPVVLAVEKEVAGVVYPRATPPAEFALSDAPAVRSALDTMEPVVCLSSPAELPPPVLQYAKGDRVCVLPVGKRAALVADGGASLAALELLAQAAGFALDNLEREQARKRAASLVGIAPASPAAAAAPAPPAATAEPRKRAGWEEMPDSEQRVHLAAQQFARARVAEMRLYSAEAVRSGRNGKSLYTSLRREIDAARETFSNKFVASCSSMVDYIHLELLHALANDDPALFGEQYPGPLV